MPPLWARSSRDVADSTPQEERRVLLQYADVLNCADVFSHPHTHLQSHQFFLLVSTARYERSCSQRHWTEVYACRHSNSKENNPNRVRSHRIGQDQRLGRRISVKLQCRHEKNARSNSTKHRVHPRPDQAPANGQRGKASIHDIHNQS